MLVDKKARAFAKMTKTWQIRQPALPRAFPGEKHKIARTFYVKNDQNYGLWPLTTGQSLPETGSVGNILRRPIFCLSFYDVYILSNSDLLCRKFQTVDLLTLIRAAGAVYDFRNFEQV